MKVADSIKILDSKEFLKELDIGPTPESYIYYTEKEATTSLSLTYTEFQNVFTENADNQLPSHHPELDHVINLVTGAKLSFDSLYNLSERELTVLKAYIDKNLKSGFIQRSTSSASALILFVKKKDSTLRLCVDYH